MVPYNSSDRSVDIADLASSALECIVLINLIFNKTIDDDKHKM